MHHKKFTLSELVKAAKTLASVFKDFSVFPGQSSPKPLKMWADGCTPELVMPEHAMQMIADRLSETETNAIKFEYLVEGLRNMGHSNLYVQIMHEKMPKFPETAKYLAQQKEQDSYDKEVKLPNPDDYDDFPHIKQMLAKSPGHEKYGQQNLGKNNPVELKVGKDELKKIVQSAELIKVASSFGTSLDGIKWVFEDQEGNNILE